MDTTHEIVLYFSLYVKSACVFCVCVRSSTNSIRASSSIFHRRSCRAWTRLGTSTCRRRASQAERVSIWLPDDLVYIYRICDLCCDDNALVSFLIYTWKIIGNLVLCSICCYIEIGKGTRLIRRKWMRFFLLDDIKSHNIEWNTRATRRRVSYEYRQISRNSIVTYYIFYFKNEGQGHSVWLPQSFHSLAEIGICIHLTYLPQPPPPHPIPSEMVPFDG